MMGASEYAGVRDVGRGTVRNASHGFSPQESDDRRDTAVRLFFSCTLQVAFRRQAASCT
jgi:hypothetical protein